MARHSLDPGYRDADRNDACVCGGWVSGPMEPGWDDHLAEALAEAGLLFPDTGRPAAEPLLAQLRREQAAIDAHHARKASRRLHWVWDLGHRKPWRSSGPVPWRHLPSLFEWVRNAHDCSDASLMCSCAGSPRFPRRVEAL